METYDDLINVLKKYKDNKISVTASSLNWPDGITRSEVRFFDENEDFIIGIKTAYDTERLYTIDTQIIYE